jgi:hypothetical protein
MYVLNLHCESRRDSALKSALGNVFFIQHFSLHLYPQRGGGGGGGGLGDGGIEEMRPMPKPPSLTRSVSMWMMGDMEKGTLQGVCGAYRTYMSLVSHAIYTTAVHHSFICVDDFCFSGIILLNAGLDEIAPDQTNLICQT